MANKRFEARVAAIAIALILLCGCGSSYLVSQSEVPGMALVLCCITGGGVIAIVLVLVI
jgi:hypothetical protein